MMLDYSYRAMKTFLDAHSCSISTTEFKTLQGKVINAKEVSDYKGEFQGKHLTLSDGRFVREYVEDDKTHYVFEDTIPKDRLEPEEEPSAWDHFWGGTKSVLQTTGNGIKGAGTGLWDVGKDTVVGVYDLVTDPIGTGEALGNMAIHPVQTYKQVQGSIVDSYQRDMINGDAQSRSHWVTYALGTAVTSVVGTKGAATSAKAGGFYG